MKPLLPTLALTSLLVTAACNPYSWDPYQEPVMVVNETTLDADGVDEATVTVYFAHAVDTAKAKVSFSATTGTFKTSKTNTHRSNEVISVAEDSVKIDSTDEDNPIYAVEKIEVTYIAPTSDGTATITAMLPTFFEDEADITLNPVVPTSVALAADGFVLERNYAKEVTLTATLDRDPGTPTKGVTVRYSIGDAIHSDQPSGAPYFRSATDSDASGKATVRLGVGAWPGDTLTVTAVPLGEDDAPLANVSPVSITLQVQGPE